MTVNRRLEPWMLGTQDGVDTRRRARLTSRAIRSHYILIESAPARRRIGPPHGGHRVTTDNATAEPLVTTATADYDVESVRAEWVGRVVATSTGRYPVEYDAIRRYCHMTGDTNPLFLDREAAAAGPYGEIIVPPPMIPNFAVNGTWPRKEKACGEDGTAAKAKRPGFTYGIPTPG